MPDNEYLFTSESVTDSDVNRNSLSAYWLMEVGKRSGRRQRSRR